MATRTSRIVISILTVLIGLLCLLSGKLFWDDAWLSIRVAFAEEQTELFEDMRREALRAEPDKAVGHLEYAVHYYPSESKQSERSRLDRIVERAQRIAIRDIIADLRSKTGEDLGDDPQPWIDKFKKRD